MDRLLRTHGCGQTVTDRLLLTRLLWADCYGETVVGICSLHKYLIWFCYKPMMSPMQIPNGANVHTIPSLATDSAVPLRNPPPTKVATM